MQSYVEHLQGLYAAVFVDIAEHYPSLRRDCERDVSRLLSLVDRRGLSFLMIDLPAAGKHFDRCLSTGLLTRFCMPGFRSYKKGSSIPRLFKGMMLRVFDEVGALRADPDAYVIRYLRQLFYGAKKVKVPCSDSRTWEHVHEFFEIDREVQSSSLNWDEDELRIDDLSDVHFGHRNIVAPTPLFPDTASISDDESPSTPGYATLDAVQRTADIVAASLGRFDPYEWRTKHGPGAVSDQRHTQFKYDFPSWPDKLSTVFPLADFGFANLGSWAAAVRSGGIRKGFSPSEPPSKLIAVPKTLKGPRLIASEPVAHQWCQQSVKDFLTTRLAKTPISRSIHFRDQTENQDFARRASHTQSHVTVDLSSASDRLSLWVVERTFRRLPSLVSALHASRTRWVVNTIDRKSPQFHKLRKFACMGSACTFPVQSYVFSILAHAAVLVSRGQNVTISSLRKASREVRVFGDDMIVPADSWIVLQGLLRHLGLKVNHEKTYATGKFRESCGLDAYDGHDVTPVYSMTYPDASRPESIVSCVATRNNFAKRGFMAVARFTESTVHKLRRFSVPYVPTGSGDFGWTDYDAKGNSHLKSRWNPSLHRREFLAHKVSTLVARSPVEADSTLLQYFTEAHAPPRTNEDRLGVVARHATKLRRGWVNLEYSY